MKLIIDIPEETIKSCKGVNWANIPPEYVDDMELAISQGILLVDVLKEIRQEVFDWCKTEPAQYVPNYDAYARCINLIDDTIEKYTEEQA